MSDNTLILVETFRWQQRLAQPPGEVRHQPADLPSEAGVIRSRKFQDSDGQRSIQLPQQIVLQLEQLRQQTGKQSIAEVIVEAADWYGRLRASEASASKQLTPRNREVLRLVAEGISTKEIATRLRISVKTAEFHRAQLMRKIGVRGVAGLVRYAVRAGVILP